MMAGQWLVLVSLVLAAVSGQEGAPEQTETEAKPVACPLEGGGFDDRFAVARLLVSQKQIEAAEACLRDAIGSTAGAYSLLSDIAAAKQEGDRALVYSSILETLTPRDGEAVFLHAQRLGQAGRWAEAVPRLRDLRSANPDNSGIVNTLGVALYHTEQFALAKTEFETAIGMSPENDAYKANLDAVDRALFGPQTNATQPSKDSTDSAGGATAAAATQTTST